MHLSTSPGGKMPNSSRSLPVLPPLSVIETIAVIFNPRMSRSADSNTNWPLPPPNVTTFVPPVICGPHPYLVAARATRTAAFDGLYLKTYVATEQEDAAKSLIEFLEKAGYAPPDGKKLRDFVVVRKKIDPELLDG